MERFIYLSIDEDNLTILYDKITSCINISQFFKNYKLKLNETFFKTNTKYEVISQNREISGIYIDLSSFDKFTSINLSQHVSIVDRFTLLKISNNQYYAIRAQNEYVQKKLVQQPYIEYEILVDFINVNSKQLFAELRSLLKKYNIKCCHNIIHLDNLITFNEKDLIWHINRIKEKQL